MKNLNYLVQVSRALKSQKGQGQKIYDYVKDNPNITVGEIYKSRKFKGLEQSMCSQVLAMFRKTGLMETQRDGKFIHYKVTNRLEEIQKAINQL